MENPEIEEVISESWNFYPNRDPNNKQQMTL